MADWEWRAYDLGTGAALGSIEMSAWSHTDILNDSGSFSGTMLGRTAALRTDYLAATTPGRSVIVPIRDGVPMGFAGIVWRRDPPNIAGASLLSYFDRQPLNTRKSYVATDQHTLIVDLVNWVQSNGGNIQVDTTKVGPSYVYRDQTWEKWEEKSVGDAIRQKGDNIGGYDFDVRVEYDAGVLTRRLRLWTPRRGRYWVDAQSNVTFRLDGRQGNVLNVPSMPVDALKLSTNVYAKGEEINSTTHERLLAESVRSDLLAAGWPRLGTTLDLSDIKDATTLQQHADGEAYLHGPTDIDQIVLDVNPDHPTWLWGSWDLGDDAGVYIRGPVQTTAPYTSRDTLPWWPNGFAEVRRVTEHRWTKDEKGVDRLQVVTGRTVD
jgi:hypothetical protein